MKQKKQDKKESLAPFYMEAHVPPHQVFENETKKRSPLPEQLDKLSLAIFDDLLDWYGTIENKEKLTKKNMQGLGKIVAEGVNSTADIAFLDFQAIDRNNEISKRLQKGLKDIGSLRDRMIND